MTNKKNKKRPMVMSALNFYTKYNINSIIVRCVRATVWYRPGSCFGFIFILRGIDSQFSTPSARRLPLFICIAHVVAGFFAWCSCSFYLFFQLPRLDSAAHERPDRKRIFVLFLWRQPEMSLCVVGFSLFSFFF